MNTPLAGNNLHPRPLDHDQESWRRPLVFSIGVHLALLALVLATPLVRFQRELPEIHTVKLFTAAELPSPPAPAAAEPAPKPVPEPPATSLAPAPPRPQPKTPRKVISLRPLKRKKRVTPPPVEKKARDTRIERSLQQIQARLARERAEAAAREKAARALEEIRRALRSTAVEKTGTGGPAAAAAGKAASPAATGDGRRDGGDQVVSLAKKRYYAAILTHLSRFWSLPDTMDWDDDLEAVVVLWLRRDGTVLKREFEKKSTNVYFNRFVEQTLDKAGSLPPFPEELPEAVLELGIRFRPHELL